MDVWTPSTVWMLDFQRIIEPAGLCYLSHWQHVCLGPGDVGRFFVICFQDSICRAQVFAVKPVLNNYGCSSNYHLTCLSIAGILVSIRLGPLNMRPHSNCKPLLRQKWRCLNLGFPFSISFKAPKNLTWQWKIHHLKMYFLLKMVIFQCHLSFQWCN